MIPQRSNARRTSASPAQRISGNSTEPDESTFPPVAVTAAVPVVVPVVLPVVPPPKPVLPALPALHDAKLLLLQSIARFSPGDAAEAFAHAHGVPLIATLGPVQSIVELTVIVQFDAAVALSHTILKLLPTPAPPALLQAPSTLSPMPGPLNGPGKAHFPNDTDTGKGHVAKPPLLQSIEIVVPRTAGGMSCAHWHEAPDAQLYAEVLHVAVSLKVV
jgi:hypothetical protein